MKNPFLIIVFALCLFQSCDNTIEEVITPINDFSGNTDVIAGSNEFGFDMLKKLNQDAPTQNQFISPLSIETALAMVINGANGQTQIDMQNAMRHREMTIDNINDGYKELIETWPVLDAQVDFNIANSIWQKEGFDIKQSFLDTNAEHFGSEITTLPFDNAAIEQINEWASNQTNGLIPEIINEIKPEAVMYLINAIYFKGDWKYSFNENYTSERPFKLNDDEEIPVEMMLMGDTLLQLLWLEDLKAVKLPYNNEAFEMTIILPHYPDNFADILEQLNNENWNTWNEGFEEYTVTMRLPKFEIEYKRELTRELSDMGMESAFGNADFSGISNNSALKLSEVLHKTFISVDEKGTEAAAITAVGPIATSPDPNAPVNFTVDRPFIFMINEAETGHVVFLGKIMNPNE